MPTDGTPLTSREQRDRLVPLRYGNEDWRPGKAAPVNPASGQRSERGMASEGVAGALGATSPSNFRGWVPASKQSALGNYLNDMKRSNCTKRMVNNEPSDSLQRMNERRAKLPQDRHARPTRSRSASCDLVSSPIVANVGNEDAGSVPPTPRSGSMSSRRLANAQSDGEQGVNYGFTRKRSVDGCNGRSSPGFLAHEETSSQHVTPRSPRQEQADQRFSEVVAYMKASGVVKEQSQALKAKSGNTHRLLYSESVIKNNV
mmetsp:Transcript_177006/g.561956  ORF Transcript_177006/g.561956 Transcript_177006/m.561956 type:complete len:259 (-) Transcript_177006:121-897(-)